MGESSKPALEMQSAERRGNSSDSSLPRLFKYVGRLTGLTATQEFGLRTLIFTHIPKTGGTTLDHILLHICQSARRKYRRARGTIYGQFLGFGKGEAQEDLQSISHQELLNCHCLTGHVPFGSHERLSERLIYVTILRHPEAQLLSHFRYGAGRGGWSAESHIEDLVHDGLMVDNPQTRQLAGLTDRSAKCSEDTLDHAIENLQKRYHLVGTSEQFDLMLRALITMMNWPDIAPDIAYADCQVTPGSPDSETREKIKRAARNVHALDMRLYEAVAARPFPWRPDVLTKLTPPLRTEERVLVSSPYLQINGRDFALVTKPIFEGQLASRLRAAGFEVRRLPA